VLVAVEHPVDSEVAVVARHEDDVDSATVVDVEDPADSEVAVEEAAASQEVEAVVASHEAVAVVVVASADADVEVTRRGLLSSLSLRLPSHTKRRSILPYDGLARVSRLLPADTTIIFRRRLGVQMGLCKRSNIRRHVGHCLKVLPRIRI
jgi:hypothetical protein